MSDSPNLSRITKKVFKRVEHAINTSDNSIFWKKHALRKVKKIFSDTDINVDHLVDYLLEQEIKSTPYELNKSTLEHRGLLMKALYNTILERIEQGTISESVVLKLIDDRWQGDFVARITQSENSYYSTYNRFPPGFVLISPGMQCNLSCEGCYASSSSKTKAHLDYDTVRKIIIDSHREWGSRSVAISGGEPLMWRSQGKSILDLAREFPYMYFKIYTNGTLITEQVAEEMASLSNITPAISIEGTAQDTDKRRGEGTYSKVIDAMHHLRNAGLPYGASITATRFNMATLLNPDYYDFLFNELGITYGWIFEYMPIGRGVETHMMPSPSERRQLFELLDEQNKNGRFICDFWSTSPSAEGCLAAGRSYGYLYINWNGDLIPCVFNPYTDTNILDVYNKGGTLTDAVENSPLFKSIRNWQNNYGFLKTSDVGNLMAPCPIRDHFSEYHSMLNEVEAKPADDAAAIALTDSEYYSKMVSYGEEVEAELGPVWKHRFCGL